MSKDTPKPKAGQLLQLSNEVNRIAGSLAQLSIGVEAPPHQDYSSSNLNEPVVPLERVSWLIRARCNRSRYLPPQIFGEPAWDILLDLLRAELAHEPVSVSSACIAASVSPSCGIRWLKVLEDYGLVLRQCDTRDDKSILVVLSPDASKALRRYFLEVVGNAAL